MGINRLSEALVEATEKMEMMMQGESTRQAEDAKSLCLLTQDVQDLTMQLEQKDHELQIALQQLQESGSARAQLLNQLNETEEKSAALSLEHSKAVDQLEALLERHKEEMEEFKSLQEASQASLVDEQSKIIDDLKRRLADRDATDDRNASLLMQQKAEIQEAKKVNASMQLVYTETTNQLKSQLAERGECKEEELNAARAPLIDEINRLSEALVEATEKMEMMMQGESTRQAEDAKSLCLLTQDVQDLTMQLEQKDHGLQIALQQLQESGSARAQLLNQLNETE